VLVVVAWAVLAGCLMGAGAIVTHSGGVQRFDARVTTMVVAHRSEGLDVVMKAVTWLGSWVALVVVGTTLVALVLRRRLSPGWLLVALVLWGGTQGAVTLAKNVVQRPRPPEHLRLVSAHGWSWPSGHTAIAALVFAVLAAEVWLVTQRPVPRGVVTVAAIVAVVAVGFSRIELGVHWTTDVLASAVFTAAWLSVAAVLLLRGREPR
jgi:undecaprenyl-diphosphatase